MVSISRPQISLTIPIYYALQDLLEDTALVGYDDDIANAMRVGMKKYQKYYDFMDNSEAYYTALILDPQVKCDLILHEIEDQEAAQMIIQATRRMLHKRYPLQSNPQSKSARTSPMKHRFIAMHRSFQKLKMSLKKLNMVSSLPI